MNLSKHLEIKSFLYVSYMYLYSAADIDVFYA